MNFIFNYILPTVCVILAAMSIYSTVTFIHKDRKKKSESVPAEHIDEYEGIKGRTHKLTSNRMPNSGIHYEDENVYINRAANIAEKSNFFKLVNGNH